MVPSLHEFHYGLLDYSLWMSIFANWDCAIDSINDAVTVL